MTAKRGNASTATRGNALKLGRPKGEMVRVRRPDPHHLALGALRRGAPQSAQGARTRTISLRENLKQAHWASVLVLPSGAGQV